MASEMAFAPQTIFRLSADKTTGEVRLEPHAWRVLAQVNGARTLAEIAASLSLPLAEIGAVAQTLQQLGLLAIDPGGAATSAFASAEFFATIEKEFVKVIGPIGPLLIEEELANLGARATNFPRDRIAELVERVSAQINDDAKRTKFQQIMLDAMRAAN